MSEQIGEAFMAQTRYEQMGPSDQARGLPQPALEAGPGEVLEEIALPRPSGAAAEPLDLTAAVERRVSLREYAAAPLSLAELSYLLWCTQGVKEVRGERATLRTVPSAGARHALETYVLANRVAGLSAGLWRFLAAEHRLARLAAPADVAERAVEACMGQGFVKSAAATFIWVADVYRMTWRYGQRGYRYLHLDAGHVCQNLYLSAEAVGCGACAIAAFDDDKLNALVGADGQNQFATYVAAVGKKS